LLGRVCVPQSPFDDSLLSNAYQPPGWFL